MTPTDRALLARAAQAAGKLRAEWDYDWLVERGVGVSRDMLWNPLDNDADTFRLAVDLSLFDGLEQLASTIAAAVDYDMCPRAATRRAVTERASSRIPS